MSTDREVVQELDAKIKEDRKSASPMSLYNAGMFFWLVGRNDKAREYIDRMIKLSNGAREVRFDISCLFFPLSLVCGIMWKKISIFGYFVKLGSFPLRGLF